MKFTCQNVIGKISVILVLIMLVSMFAGCNSGKNPATTNPQITTSATQATTSATQTTTPATQATTSTTHATTKPSRVEMSAPDLAEYVQKRTVTINVKTENGSGTGSGFFIGDDGTIATSYHVIDGATEIKVEIFDGGTYSVQRIVDFNALYDVAIIKIDVENTPYLKLCDEKIRTGETVYAVGSSLGFLNGTFSNGMISSAARPVGIITCIQTTAPISEGNSGGPLVNAYGEVVGINAFSYARGNSLNLAVHIDHLQDLARNKNWTLNKFREWYDKEIHRSYKIYDVENDEFLDSKINTYQIVTGATCKYSTNDYDFSDKVSGYKEEYMLYWYDYKVDEFDKYTEYLSSVGFEYQKKEEYADGTSYYYMDTFNYYRADIFVTTDYVVVYIYY